MTGTQVSLERQRGTLHAAEQLALVRNFLFQGGNVSGSAGITGVPGKALAGAGGNARRAWWGHQELCPTFPKEWQQEMAQWGCIWGCGSRHLSPSGE